MFLKAKPEFLLERFIRTYPEAFSAKDLQKLLSCFGLKFPLKEVEGYLRSCEYVFVLEKNLYITRCGAFTGCYFSFVPTEDEIKKKVFVAADRCMPFTDNEIVSCDLKFVFDGKPLPAAIYETDSNTAMDLHTFFGDEYTPQYVASDPINKEMDLVATEFQLPSCVKLSGFSLEPVFEKHNLKFGDRFLCRLLNWDEGIIELSVLPAEEGNELKMSPENFAHQKWQEILEDALLKSFDKMGPCVSMEEQLANVFYENRKELCDKNCCSLHEFLNQTKKISLELYGVETRLWRPGEEVPAIGSWNKEILDDFTEMEKGVFMLPDYIIDCFLKNEFFDKKEIKIKELIEKIVPDCAVLTPQDVKALTLNIKSRRDILKKQYNWFADFNVAEIRKQMLDLYSRIGEVVYKIDQTTGNLENFPQTELVILSQLFAHITQMLESLNEDPQGAAAEEDAIYMSLDGMEFNFEEILDALTDATDYEHESGFKLV